MENILRAARAGTVAKVNAVAGDTLALDQLVLELDDLTAHAATRREAGRGLMPACGGPDASPRHRRRRSCDFLPAPPWTQCHCRRPAAIQMGERGRPIFQLSYTQSVMSEPPPLPSVHPRKEQVFSPSVPRQRLIPGRFGRRSRHALGRSRGPKITTPCHELCEDFRRPAAGRSSGATTWRDLNSHWPLRRTTSSIPRPPPARWPDRPPPGGLPIVMPRTEGGGSLS